MAEIIQERELKTHTKVELCFYKKDTDEVWYGFPMMDGEIVPCRESEIPNVYEKCTEDDCPWWENYLDVKDNEEFYSKVETHSWNWYEPAIALCDKCKGRVYLASHTNVCDGCGELYNLFGQHLLPYHMWEEN